CDARRSRETSANLPPGSKVEPGDVPGRAGWALSSIRISSMADGLGAGWGASLGDFDAASTSARLKNKHTDNQSAVRISLTPRRGRGLTLSRQQDADLFPGLRVAHENEFSAPSIALGLRVNPHRHSSHARHDANCFALQNGGRRLQDLRLNRVSAAQRLLQNRSFEHWRFDSDLGRTARFHDRLIIGLGENVPGLQIAAGYVYRLRQLESPQQLNGDGPMGVVFQRSAPQETAKAVRLGE